MADTVPDRVPLSPDAPAIGAVLISYGSGDQDVLALGRGKPRALYITTAGNLKVDTAAGDVGIVHPFVTGPAPLQVTKIYQTSSTAAGVIWW